MSGFRQHLNDFRSDRRGAVAAIFALSLIVLLLVAGVAIDTARYHDISNRMQQALDGATLAAAKMLSDPNVSDTQVRERAEAYFRAAIPTFGVKASAIGAPSINIDRANSTVEVLGQAEVPTFFGAFAGMPSLTVINQKSKVAFDITKLELAMVLDITGSMCQPCTKIGDLKTAAKDVIDTLFDGALYDTDVRIAVAPYSASVNAGALAGAVSSSPSASICTNTWFGTRCTTIAGIAADTCVIERQGPNAATDAAPVGADLLPNVPILPYGNYNCPVSNVVPLMDRTQRDSIKAIIDTYVAQYSTAGHIGTAWGWYLLSPNWAGVLPADSAPGPYGDRSVQKAMIIMTDGVFNTSYISGPLTDAATQASQSYAQFDQLCTNIRGKGIQIFTVGFELPDANALAHLQSCASSITNFFDARNGSELKDAFKAIANKLGNLRVAS